MVEGELVSFFFLLWERRCGGSRLVEEPSVGSKLCKSRSKKRMVKQAVS